VIHVVRACSKFLRKESMRLFSCCQDCVGILECFKMKRDDLENSSVFVHHDPARLQIPMQ
jgi:hypothetical protein